MWQWRREQRKTVTQSETCCCITAEPCFHSNYSNMPPYETVTDRKLHTNQWAFTLSSEHTDFHLTPHYVVLRVATNNPEFQDVDDEVQIETQHGDLNAKHFNFFLLVFQDWKTSHWYSRFSRTTLKHQSMSKIMHRGFGVWESPAAKNLHFKQKWNFSWSQTLAFRLLCGYLNIFLKFSKDFHVDRKIKMYQEVFVIAGERIIISESLNWL